MVRRALGTIAGAAVALAATLWAGAFGLATASPVGDPPTLVRDLEVGAGAELVGSRAAPQEGQAMAGLTVLLASERPSYRAGEPVTFILAVDNPTDAPVTVPFTSGQTFEIVVAQEQAEVWRWSADMMFTAALRSRAFAPGLTLLGRETWNGHDPAGGMPAAGVYRATATLTANPPRAGNVVEVVIEAP